MGTATHSSLTEQAERLSGLAQQLTDGRLLEPVLRLAQSGEVWSGPVHDAFLAWLQHGLDFWVRNQLAEGVHLVARALADRAAAFEQAQQAMASGQVGVVGPAAPSPLGYTPGTPPPFGQIGGGFRSTFDVEAMRRLSRLLGETADGAVIEFSRKLGDALEPPLLPPGPPGAPPRVSPLPPDADAAAGSPKASSASANAYLALADELRNAASDIAKRANTLRLLEEPIPTVKFDIGSILERIRSASAAADSAVAKDAQTRAGPEVPPATEAAVPSREDVEWSRREGAKAADSVADILDDQRFDAKDHEKLFIALTKAEQHADDPAFAAAFVESFVPDGLRSWCKLVANSVVDLRAEMDILRPLSRLVGTASMAGEQQRSETHEALLDSPCLDTLVHYGSFDTDFALVAARRILEDPSRYHRADGSDRVYSQLTRDGRYETGDARVGALALLANNPQAARIIAESKGPSGRMLLLRALEEDGPVGTTAAAALEAGLADLNRVASENTLEVLIKMVNSGELELKGAGKACLARLLTSQDMLEKLANATFLTKEGRGGRRSDAVGFGVVASKLEGTFGKILDDEAARAEFSSRLAVQSSALLKEKAMTYAADSGGDPLGPLLKELGDLGNLYQAITEGAYGAASQKEANVYAVAGLKKALTETLKLIPGAGLATTLASTAIETQGREWIDEFLGAEEKKRVENLDPEGLAKELEQHLRPLATLALFTNPELVKHLIPPGSPTAARFAAWVHYDEQGNPTVTIPPPSKEEEPGNDPTSWNSFIEALGAERDTEGSALGEAVTRIDDKVETFKPRRG